LFDNHTSDVHKLDRTSSSQDLSFLQELVDIDSRSKKAEGVQKVQECVAQRLKQMGFSIEMFANPSYESADLLVATLKGELPFQVSFIGHADTVLGPSRVHQFRSSDDGKTIWGPGVADNKGGVLVALRGLEHYLSQATARPTLVFVCSPSEETGSLGFHHHFARIGAQSEVVLGFEPAMNNGSLIRGRHGNRWYKIKIKGKPFHAGRFGESAINAAHEAALKISQFIQLNQATKKVKVNVGSIKAGEGHYNIICGESEILLDTRFPCFQTRDELHERIISILDQQTTFCEITNKPAQTFWSLEDDCPPMAPCFDENRLASLYLASVEKIEGKSFEAGFTGGAADINYFSTGQNFCLDGLGPIAAGMHTIDERIEVSSLFSRARSLALFLHRLSEQGFFPRRYQ
jgi:glutamate carboxypeptidase